MNDQTQALAKKTTFPVMLRQFQQEIERALPKHLSGDRMTRIALTEFRKNPKLAECDPRSVFAAVIIAAQAGLEPGLMGEAYLIPYKNYRTDTMECQMIPGFQGLMKLVRQAGGVKRIEAHVVHDKDGFEYKTGLTTTLEHEPCLKGDPGPARLAYAVAEFSDGGYHVEVMTKTQIEKIRNESTGYKNAVKYKSSNPWIEHEDEMWRKTLIRRICKYLPKSAELALAVSLDDASTRGPQELTTKDAIDGTWAPTPQDQQEPPEPRVVQVTSSKPPDQTEPTKDEQRRKFFGRAKEVSLGDVAAKNLAHECTGKEHMRDFDERDWEKCFDQVSARQVALNQYGSVAEASKALSLKWRSVWPSNATVPQNTDRSPEPTPAETDIHVAWLKFGEGMNYDADEATQWFEQKWGVGWSAPVSDEMAATIIAFMAAPRERQPGED